MADKIEDDDFNDLTLSEKAFCEEYVIDCNAKQAVIRSGHDVGAHHASRLIKKGKFIKYIEYLRKNAVEMAGVTIIRNLRELAVIAYPGKGRDAEGNEIDVYQAKPMDRLKAIEVINKMCAFNAPEEVTMTTKSELDGKTDEELAAIIEAKRQQRKSLSE